jgi:hypothetical protein
MMIKIRTALLLVSAMTLFSGAAMSDTYLFYMPSTMPGMIGNDADSDGRISTSEMFSNLELIITNTDSRSVVTMSLTPYLQKSGYDSYSFGANDYTVFDGTPSTNSRVFQDFKSNVLTVRENGVLQVRDKGADGVNMTGDDGDNRVYDRILTLNVETGVVLSETLVAKSQSDYDHAVAQGFTVVLEETGDTGGIVPVSVTTYSQNLTNTGDDATVETKGNFSTSQISSADGTSLFREEGDGTVHIGENSIVFSLTGTDRIHSSVGELHIGNSSSHRTIIEGTLEIQDPTEPFHAATKRYVDGAVATAMAMGSIPKAGYDSSMFGMGLGHHAGQSAIAMGVSTHDAQRNMTLNLSAGYNSTVSDASVSAGVGWGF